MKRLLSSLIFVGLFPACVFSADDLTSDQRFEKLERKVGTLTDLTLRFDRLQKENRDLRGQIETLQYQLETLKRKQRDLYVDIDERISNIQISTDTNSINDQVSKKFKSEPNVDEKNLSRDFKDNNESRFTSIAPSIETRLIDPKKIRNDYKKAYELIGPSQRRYDEAAMAFSEFLKNYPASPLAANAQYWLAETFYVRQKNNQALSEFQKVVSNYPDSSKVPGALYKIGRLEHILGDSDKARNTLKRLVADYPKAPAAGLAKELFKKIGG